MNELLKEKEMNQAAVWWEDDASFQYFNREINSCYEKVLERVFQKVVSAKEPAKEANPIMSAIKKPAGDKGLRAQGYKGKGRVAAFYS